MLFSSLDILPSPPAPSSSSSSSFIIFIFFLLFSSSSEPTSSSIYSPTISKAIFPPCIGFTVYHKNMLNSIIHGMTDNLNTSLTRLYNLITPSFLPPSSPLPITREMMLPSPYTLTPSPPSPSLSTYSTPILCRGHLLCHLATLAHLDRRLQSNAFRYRQSTPL